MSEKRRVVVWFCVVVIACGAILMTSPSWRAPKLFDDEMAISNARLLIATRGDWSQSFFRSRVRPLWTVILLPSAAWELGVKEKVLFSASDNRARPWHLFEEPTAKNVGGSYYSVSTVWILCLTAAAGGGIFVLGRALTGSNWISAASATFATWLLTKELLLPITQGLNWVFGIAIALGLYELMARLSAHDLRIGLAIGLALLAGQEIAPALAGTCFAGLFYVGRGRGPRRLLRTLALWGGARLCPSRFITGSFFEAHLSNWFNL